jgi:hypothetical protein
MVSFEFESKNFMTQVPKLNFSKEKLQKQIGGYLEGVQDRHNE